MVERGVTSNQKIVLTEQHGLKTKPFFLLRSPGRGKAFAAPLLVSEQDRISEACKGIDRNNKILMVYLHSTDNIPKGMKTLQFTLKHYFSKVLIILHNADGIP